jgi:hypothetical protein
MPFFLWIFLANCLLDQGKTKIGFVGFIGFFQTKQKNCQQAKKKECYSEN